MPPPPRSLAATGTTASAADAAAKNVVLVHGGFVDGAGWKGVYDLLKKDGYTVSIVQNPTTSLSDDVAATRQAIDKLDGPVVLVGHSYGGVVISEAGTHEKVQSVVYIAAFAPDRGESASSLIANPPAGAPVPPILPPVDGFLFLDKAKFAASFAADVDAEIAAFMSKTARNLIDIANLTKLGRTA
ncbi:esterase/lipase family protein [Ensifer sp. 4252]|uniref:esterase/lipase family protein n=1 Tax=Ensifer sp. 4252 TaxID=3373915 RepID=UPI003D21E223